MLDTTLLLPLRERFVYKADGKLDSWRVFSKGDKVWAGDCDDYAVTALWLLSKEDKSTFWWNLLVGNAVFWLVVAPSGENHVRLLYKGYWLCNIKPKPSKTNTMKKIFPMVLPIAAIKLLLGKLT